MALVAAGRFQLRDGLSNGYKRHGSRWGRARQAFIEGVLNGKFFLFASA